MPDEFMIIVLQKWLRIIFFNSIKPDEHKYSHQNTQLFTNTTFLTLINE